ncbi:MAG: FtsX-like permease family protein [Lachnospiraceae bacterium]|nr:FtsX-like permease family protein [Lachnospiraceae bacterium]
MLKNNNQTAVKRLGIRSLKQNKTRNLFTVLAIVLTTFMFTTVFSIGFSLGRNLNTMMLRQQGSKASITLNQPTREQIEKAEQTKDLNAAGIEIPVGVVTDATGKTNLLLDYYDHNEFSENFEPAIGDLTGNYPKKENEIMLSQAALSALEIKKPVTGMKIVLRIGGEEKEFVLSGWFTDYSYTAGGFHGLVSKACTESLGLTREENGVLSMSAKPGRQDALYEELEESLSLKTGQKLETTYDVQEENNGNALAVAVAVALMGLIIVMSGYLLIYNIMYISVTKDIRFYGMLKTVGTSPRQIRKIVKMQVMRLCLWGIPIGVVLGTLLSFVAVPYALRVFQMENDSAMPSDISFNPFIYVGTIVFAVITVVVSCRKPARLAGRISAVEALKYNGQQQEKNREKHTTNGGKLYKMAFRNVFRERKRTILVFASLFMGIMAFLSVDTFLGSLKLENYVEYYLPDDYTIYTNSGLEENSEEEEEEISYVRQCEQMATDISRIPGVKRVSVNRSADVLLKFDENVFAPFLKKDAESEENLKEMIEHYRTTTKKEQAYAAPVIAVSSEMMERYNEKARQKIDIERFEKGEICLMGMVNTKEESETVQGREITLMEKEGNRSLTLEVGACPIYNEDHGINIGYYWQKGGAPSCILISEAAMQKLTDKTSVDNIIVNCEKKAEPSVTKQIKALAKMNPAVLHLEIKSEMITYFQSSMVAMNILGAGISIVLILIGILNFVNVMLTGVFTRRGELAVMESVGMTKGQIKRMLTYEGVYYGVITCGLVLTVGNAIIYLIANMAQNMADYAVFHYPAAWMSVLAFLILVICMFVPVVVYHLLSRESVTERLRMAE